MSTITRIFVGLVVFVPFLYITSCSVISRVHEHDFALVKEGDAEAHVITTMGQPSDEERAGGRRVPRYDAPECVAPCVQRLWYLNRLSIVGEAWMIELSDQGRVVRTAYIVSP
ncbi:hypothetical protein [Dyella sp.]|jgi:hypothetical protein|uniref:hypothetical protein n=1 Tax=Dyella sp. TaxID=1869338 RepID=UPI002FD90266